MGVGGIFRPRAPQVSVRILLATGLAFAAVSNAAEPLRFASGSSQVTLIELYTSEGCSSCPPADSWLGSLRDRPGLWTEFVPVEFHVDYWNGLGWRDRLSSREFTARQHAYASAWGSQSVYTPCFVRNGAEWKPIWGGSVASSRRAGSLSIEVGAGDVCLVAYVPDAATRAAAGPYDIHVVLLGGGVSSRVTAGENRGATLGHEFVVLAMVNDTLVPDAATHAHRATLKSPRSSLPGLKRRALAAWVTLSDELTPIQATGGWLPSSD
jgi:hypothetical protein